MHIDELCKRLKIKLGFLYRNRTNRRQIEDKLCKLLMSVIDYGDIIYMHATASTLKSLDATYHYALRFIMGASYRTHHCVLYQNVGWTSESVRREQHALVFVYKALLNKPPSYLSSLNIIIIIPKTRSQAWITLEAHAISTELGMAAFSCYAPCLWNSLQTNLNFRLLSPCRPF